jgi:hypothetical protein
MPGLLEQAWIQIVKESYKLVVHGGYNIFLPPDNNSSLKI